MKQGRCASERVVRAGAAQRAGTRRSIEGCVRTGACPPLGMRFGSGHFLPVKCARDGTMYGKSRASATNFYTHHAQRISMAD